MKIIPTKKALPLFSEFTKVQQQFIDVQPFYSWHANYFTLNRKKILVLVNDLSYSPIILANINVKNKKELPNLIRQDIEDVFSYSNVSPIKTNDYLKKASSMEISSIKNHSIITINNNLIQHTKRFSSEIDFNTNLQPKIMKILAGIPYKSQTPSYAISTEIVKLELDK